MAPPSPTLPTMDADWFKDLFGFTEQSPEQVRTHLEVDGTRLRSRINGTRYRIGVLETPSLGALRTRAGEAPKGPIRVSKCGGGGGRAPWRLP